MKSTHSTRTSHSPLSEIPTVPLYVPKFAPLKSHWTVQGLDRMREYEQTYKSLPSAFKEQA